MNQDPIVHLPDFEENAMKKGLVAIAQFSFITKHLLKILGGGNSNIL